MQYELARGVAIKEIDGELLIVGSGRKILRVTGTDLPAFRQLSELLQSNADVDADLVCSQLKISLPSATELLEKCLELGIVNLAIDKNAPPSSAQKNFLRANYFANYFPSGQAHLDFLEAIHSTKLRVVASGSITVELIQQLAAAGFGDIEATFENSKISSLDIENSTSIPERAIGLNLNEAFEIIFQDNPTKFSSCVLNPLDDLSSMLSDFDGNDIRNIYTIVCLPQYDSNFLHSFNEQMLSAKLPWTMIAPIFGKLSVISFCAPYTACFNCLEKRLESNAMYWKEFITQNSALDRNIVHQYFSADVALSLSVLVAELFKLIPITGERFERILQAREKSRNFEEYNDSIRHLRFGLPDSWGALNSVGLSPLSVEKKSVLRLPRCTKCGLNGTEIPPALPWSSPL